MQTTNRPTDDFLTVRTNKGIESLAFSDIIYFKADRKHTIIYLTDPKKPQRVLLTISSLEDSLPTDLFFMSHRSYIINMEHRKLLGKDHKILLTDGHYVPISEERIPEYLQRTNPIRLKTV